MIYYNSVVKTFLKTYMMNRDPKYRKWKIWIFPKKVHFVQTGYFYPIWAQNSIPVYFVLGSRDLFKTRSDDETPGIKKYEMFQKTLI